MVVKCAVSESKYAEAIAEFDDFIVKYPKKKKLIEDSYFWKGESYFHLARNNKFKRKQRAFYTKAILSYQNIVTDFPNSIKTVASLYKIGLSSEALGFHQDAKVFYELIVQKYPKSILVPQAKKRLSILKARSKNKKKN